MNITKEEAIRLLGRYDTEYYTPQTREAHRMGIAALNRVEELEKELADERHRHDRYVDFELAEAEELRKLKEERRWIPVTEMLPEQGQEVIVYDGGVLKPKVFCYLFWDKDFDNWARVTHWMPLPEAPKEVE